jgi:cyclopropane-fatty-acyl-phospholipid synthase
MKTREIDTANRPTQITLSILAELFRTHPNPEFAVRLWNGTTWRRDASLPCRFTLVLSHPGALRKMLDPPTELTMGEAFIYGDVDIEGDVEAACSLADHLGGMEWSVPEKIRLGLRLHTLPRDGSRGPGRHAAEVHGDVHSEERDRQAVSYHYDTSNEFFSLWLDKRMVYSCAYFKTPEDDIDAAQEQKLEYLCRKLRLRPGDRLLDIGCGWGGLVMYAAQVHNVHVLGVTVSKRQAELAAARIQEAGLGELCKVEVRDYREIDQPSGFDKLISVGMFEHVGEVRLPQYFYQAWRLLRPGGVFLNHGIARNTLAEPPSVPSFSDRYVFPDGETVPIEVTLGIAAKAGFEIRDVESLREHYALTLRRWVSRLEAHHDEAVAATDETTYRIWRLFMAGSAYGFTKGALNVYQALLAKPDEGRSGLPLRRSDWYAG